MDSLKVLGLEHLTSGLTLKKLDVTLLAQFYFTANLHITTPLKGLNNAFDIIGPLAPVSRSNCYVFF